MKNGFSLMEIMGFTLADVDQKMLMNFVREDEIA